MKDITKKRKLQAFVLFMLALALIAGSVTYALYQFDVIYKGNKENGISSCTFNIDIKENNPINLVGTYPMDDSEASKLEPYKFSITPNSQTCNTLKYNITVVSNCDSCTKTNGICNDNNLCNCNDGYQIDPNLIKYELTNKTTGEKTVGVNPYKMGVAGSMTVGTTINFELRMWIINSATNDDLYIKENGSYKEDSNGLILTKNFCSKVKITGTDDPYFNSSVDKSGANMPVLASHMIPVYYDETNSVWKKADVSNTDTTNPWYSYNSTGEYKGRWANAVTVTSTNRATYLNAAPGTEIPMDDINTMWVWIPRFNATTPSNYNGGTKDNPRAIDVTFVKQNETAIDAFTFGTKSLSGFWYAKFETSHTTLASSTTNNNLGCTNETCSNANGIIIKPNVTSLRYNNVSNFFFASRSMEQTGNNFGFVNTEVDTHMSKNNEWGAVAYLTHSIYGRCTSSTTCKEVGINNNKNYITGYGAPARSTNSAANGTYDTTLGKDASTTGTIYGIYDMSGGAFEYVMGVYNKTIGDSGFSSLPDTKYYNNYKGTTYTGHALTETKNWYSDSALFVEAGFPWFMRGGFYDIGADAGVFYFCFGGFADLISNDSSHLVISNE